MSFLTLAFIALLGGIFLAIQAGFNAQLGTYLNNPYLTVIISSTFSVLFGSILIFITQSEYPQWNAVKSVPWYLWASGGLFSVAGISIYFYAIPKIGIATMITLGLSGQLVFALVAGHFGWLNLPQEPLSPTRLIGALCMLLGILLINNK